MFQIALSSDKQTLYMQLCRVSHRKCVTCFCELFRKRLNPFVLGELMISREFFKFTCSWISGFCSINKLEQEWHNDILRQSCLRPNADPQTVLIGLAQIHHLFMVTLLNKSFEVYRDSFSAFLCVNCFKI